MRLQTVYSVFAVILPVSLGLGLVHLSNAGRIDAATAVAVTLGIAIVMAAGVLMRDAAERSELGEDET